MSKFKRDVWKRLTDAQADLMEHKMASSPPHDHGSKYLVFGRNVVECEKCGCLLKEGTAIRGESEVRKTWNRYPGLCGEPLEVTVGEYIHTPYYCKIHAP